MLRLFVGALVKLLRATIKFVMSVSLSVREETLGSHWTDFCVELVCESFSKNCEEIFIVTPCILSGYSIITPTTAHI